MKKISVLLLILFPLIFFSCATGQNIVSGAAAKDGSALMEDSPAPSEGEDAASFESDSDAASGADSPDAASETSGAESPAEEDLSYDDFEEKIPENEVAELERLLEEENLPEEKIEDEIAALDGEDASENAAASGNAADSDNEAAPFPVPAETAVVSDNEPASESAAVSDNAPASENAAVSESAPNSNNAASSATAPAAAPVSGNGAATAALPSSRQSSDTQKRASEPQDTRPPQDGIKDGSDIAAAYDFSEGAESGIEEEKEPEKFFPSRTVSVKNNQFLDIVYPGSGWIYLGEVEQTDPDYDRGHFIFQGRKLGKGETTFTLRSKKSGKALLHFYKNDGLTGKYIDDYIEVSVKNESASGTEHERAPDYADFVPPKYDRKTELAQNDKSADDIKKAEEKSGFEGEQKNKAPAEEAARNPAPGADRASGENREEPSEKVQTVIQTDAASSENSRAKTAVAGSAQPSVSAGSAAAGETQKAASSKPSDLLEQAKKAYEEKRYADALNLVQQFFDVATEDFDAALFLEGLILEAKSEVQNIKSAIDAYDTLIKNYPQSGFWRRANERAIYLKRFYIDIR